MRDHTYDLVGWVCRTSVDEAGSHVARATDTGLLRQCLEYERTHGNRKGIIRMVERRIRKLEKAPHPSIPGGI